MSDIVPVSMTGMLASAVLDLPTGATVICAFGLTLFAWWALTHPSARRST